MELPYGVKYGRDYCKIESWDGMKCGELVWWYFLTCWCAVNSLFVSHTRQLDAQQQGRKCQCKTSIMIVHSSMEIMLLLLVGGQLRSQFSSWSTAYIFFFYFSHSRTRNCRQCTVNSCWKYKYHSVSLE